MRGLLLAVILIAGASAQSPIDPAQIPALLSGITQRPAEISLGCGFSPIPPVLDFTFRFQAGYVFRLSADQYKAGPHAWVVLTEVTPRGVDGKPSWVFARAGTDLVKTAGFNLEISGAYLLGQGSYTVESTLYDDVGGSCQHKWTVRASLARGQRGVQLSMPPFAVRGAGGLGAADWKPAAGGPALTILLDAAPLASRRTRLNPGDADFLVRVLTAIVGGVPAASVRLVVFNLDKQKEIFRRDAFSIDAIGEVRKAIATLELSSVDVSVLAKPLGYVDFLAGLIDRELGAPAPASTVILLGPLSRHGGKFPKGELKPAAATQFFYVQYKPDLQRSFSRGGAGEASGPPNPRGVFAAAGFPTGFPGPAYADIINAAMISLKGKTLVVRTPADLAKAIAVVQHTR
jgi:hypothetical protein